MNNDFKTLRKNIENYIIKSISEIDLKNGERYKKFFKSLSDSQFKTFLKMLKEKKTQLTVYFPNLQHNITNQKVFDLAEKFKIMIEDKIQLKNPISNMYYYPNHKYMILKLPVRRVKQFVFDKSRLPESDTHISKLSGQVMKPDKGAKISLVETYMLASKGLEKSIIELIKIRGGDISNYYKLKFNLLNKSTASLSELDLDKHKPKSVIVLDSYLKAMHIDVNLDNLQKYRS